MFRAVALDAAVLPRHSPRPGRHGPSKRSTAALSSACVGESAHCRTGMPIAQARPRRTSGDHIQKVPLEPPNEYLLVSPAPRSRRRCCVQRIVRESAHRNGLWRARWRAQCRARGRDLRRLTVQGARDRRSVGRLRPCAHVECGHRSGPFQLPLSRRADDSARPERRRLRGELDQPVRIRDERERRSGHHPLHGVVPSRLEARRAGQARPREEPTTPSQPAKGGSCSAYRIRSGEWSR